MAEEHIPDVIPSQDATVASTQSYDIAIIGSGILGSALACSLARSGRSVLLIERDLSEPDRIVGELLQPGGCIALQKVGMGDCLEGTEAIGVAGYKVFWGGDQVEIPYPVEKTEMAWSEGGIGNNGRRQEGRSFHHGRFVQKLRGRAASTEGVTLIEATVNELMEDEVTKTVVGVMATPKKSTLVETTTSNGPLKYHATLTFVTDGCFSKFRRGLLPSHVVPIVRSNFIALMLEDADLPAPNHGHVILRKPSLLRPTSTSLNGPTVGPVLVYQLSPHDTRMLIDIPGAKVPSSSNGDLQNYLMDNVIPMLPKSIIPSFEEAINKSTLPTHRIRSMPNSYLPAYPQGRSTRGVILAGDAMNMRHPLTGGGMTVAMNDCVILTELLGGGKQVGVVEGDKRGVVGLDQWDTITERLEEWHWRRKGIATCINVLAQALYSLFGADDENLEVLKVGCFKYFELGGECVGGPVSLLSALRPSPFLLIYHFFAVALYSIYILFTSPRPTPTEDDPKAMSTPSILEYPELTIKSAKVFYAALVVLLPVLWSEGQM